MLIEAYCKFFQQVSKPSANPICQQPPLKMERQQPDPGGDRYEFAPGKAKVKNSYASRAAFVAGKERRGRARTALASQRQL